MIVALASRIPSVTVREPFLASIKMSEWQGFTCQKHGRRDGEDPSLKRLCGANISANSYREAP